MRKSYRLCPISKDAHKVLLSLRSDLYVFMFSLYSLEVLLRRYVSWQGQSKKRDTLFLNICIQYSTSSFSFSLGHYPVHLPYGEGYHFLHVWPRPWLNIQKYFLLMRSYSCKSALFLSLEISWSKLAKSGRGAALLHQEKVWQCLLFIQMINIKYEIHLI